MEEIHIPKRAHLRKVRKRLERLEEIGLHDWWRQEPGRRFEMPNKRERREYIETFDLVMRDIDGILIDLMGSDDNSFKLSEDHEPIKLVEGRDAWKPRKSNYTTEDYKRDKDRRDRESS